MTTPSPYATLRRSARRASRRFTRAINSGDFRQAAKDGERLARICEEYHGHLGDLLQECVFVLNAGSLDQQFVDGNAKRGEARPRSARQGLREAVEKVVPLDEVTP